jgi:hypothetical protein
MPGSGALGLRPNLSKTTKDHIFHLQHVNQVSYWVPHVQQMHGTIRSHQCDSVLFELVYKSAIQIVMAWPFAKLSNTQHLLWTTSIGLLMGYRAVDCIHGSKNEWTDARNKKNDLNQLTNGCRQSLNVSIASAPLIFWRSIRASHTAAPNSPGW